MDRDARVLVQRARAMRDSVGQTIRAYSGTVKERVGIALRTPLKDRTLFRAEAAARVYWNRDDGAVIKLLGAKQQHPGSEYTRNGLPSFSFDELYDPTQDRLYFGMTGARDDDVWIDHPLLEEMESSYRFQTGDTLTMTFPTGQRVQVVELRIFPRINKPRLIAGSIWIEPVSGAIVKGAFRSSATFDMVKDTDELDDDEDLEDVPAVFKPFLLDVTLITIEYSFWRMKHWMPRTLRMEGIARAGILSAPGALELSYQIDEVIDDDTATVASAASVMRAWRDENGEENRTQRRRNDGLRGYLIYPEDMSKLAKSPDIPPPIWEHSDDFITEKELRRMYSGVASLPLAPNESAVTTLTFGYRAGDLIRYNRVEGLSLGVRAQTKLVATTYAATVRLGAADLQPNAAVSMTRSTMKRTIAVTVFHELQAVDARSLQPGASASALLLGRDDGEYYRSSGARISFSPPASRPDWLRLTLFAERQRAAERETTWSLSRLIDGDRLLRPNLVADAADLAGAELGLRGWWGTDPTGFQFGLEAIAEGATGDFDYGRGSLTARAAFPLLGSARGALELGAGTTTHGIPAQKQFFLGGAHTLRGYAGSSAVGTSFTRARGEIAKTFASNAFSLALFSDAGWAGERADFRTEDALLSAGVGMSVLDGLLRIDLARALRRPTGWRLELHLDAIL